MPSSLIFVGLVVAWLLILVPIVARRRQEVARPSEAALACRVLERPGVSRRVEEVSGMDEPKPDGQLLEDVTSDAVAADEVAAESGATPEAEPPPDAGQGSEREAGEDPEPDAVEAAEEEAEDDAEEEPDAAAEALSIPEADSAAAAAEPPAEPPAGPPAEPPAGPPAGQPVEPTAPRPGRGYRSGRGGFDPEAAMLAAKARYSFRQRVVLALVLAMITTAIGAVVADQMLWWGHAGVDLFLVGYLAYLRRQVRIEEDIRLRRAARMAGTRRGRTVAEYVAQRAGDPANAGAQDPQAADEPFEDPALPELEPLPPEQREQHDRALREREQPALPPLRPTPLPAAPAGTVVIDLDDEDPGLHDLADPGPRGYRRAVGE
ncbi:MAG: hypothetical protein JWR88_855 [Pseudonocardia sp.]|nr:hypothetical protein [Pseudonocardia sp.]